MRTNKMVCRSVKSQICYAMLVFILLLSWLILYRTCSLIPNDDNAATNTLSIGTQSQLLNPSLSSNSELLYGLFKGLQIRRKNFKKLNSQSKRLTVVFIVGVEGVGHHLWEDIFDSLSQYTPNIVIDKYYTSKRKAPSSNLQPCLLTCFSATLWAETKVTSVLEKSLSIHCPSCLKHINNSCHCVLTEIQKYSENLPDGSILFLNHALSYTFWDLNVRNHPDLNVFIDYFQGDTYNNMRNIFDVRLIVMKRDYINSMVSSCVSRFNGCIKRIQFLSKMLSVIQAQLISIDTQFWIMLDYDDIMKRKHMYVDIVSDWIGVDKQFVSDALEDAVKVKKKKEGIHLYKGVERSGWDKLRYDVQDIKDRDAHIAMKRVFYQQGKNQWPVFNSSYFVVQPENRAFLDSKYHLQRK